MKLSALIDRIRREVEVASLPNDDPILGGLAVDSREVAPGSLYFAYPGVSADGHDFVNAAVAAGAVAVVAERPLATTVPVVRVADARRAAECAAEEWYHNPAAKLNVAAVTGTNGKSTTTTMLRHLLGTLGMSGSIGTLGAYDGAGERVPSQAGTLTTPGPVDLQRTFRAMVDRGVKWVTMEASSHALDQHRLDRIRFEAAVFTNLTREHLDYHSGMDAYRAAKLGLAKLVTADGTLSVNHDDPAWMPLRDDPRAITWGRDSDAGVRIADIRLTTGGSNFRLAGRFGDAIVRIPQPGEWNISNAVAAAVVALALGVELGVVVERLADSPQVPGRMELLASAPCHVFRDYAHTPDAMQRLLATFREIASGRIILVFGCGGDRDRGKRSEMGEIAAAGADLTILTTDNPRSEDPGRIIDDITLRMPPGSYRRVLDREEAIGQAITEAGPQDTVILAGKGHETYQHIGAEKLPFDEKAIVERLVG